MDRGSLTTDSLPLSLFSSIRCLGSSLGFPALPQVIIDFTATWCGPCQRIAPFFEELSTKYPSVTFVKVDVDECADTAHACSISAMPTFACFDAEGELAGTISGADQDKLAAFVGGALAGGGGGGGPAPSVAVEVEDGECTT